MIQSRSIFIIMAIIISIVTSGFLISSNNVEQVEDPIGGVDRAYYFRVELSQWTIKVIDLNRIEDMALQGKPISEALKKSTYVDNLGSLEPGSKVFLQIYSLDLQHGFTINELDIIITITETTTDISSTIPYFYDFVVPDIDTTYTAFCQVFCGLGHSNMKLKFDVGDGESNYGKFVFSTFVILIGVLGILFLYLISRPIKRKVYLSPQNLDSRLKTKSNKFILYDITKFSEKQLVALRLQSLEIDKNGEIIQTVTAISYDKAKLKMFNNEISKNWMLIEFN